MKRPPTKARILAQHRAQDFNIETSLKEFPDLAEALHLYSQCRSQQVVTFEKSKGKDTVLVRATYPTGYHFLPEEGGYMDQSVYMMALFEAFIAGERIAFSNS